MNGSLLSTVSFPVFTDLVRRTFVKPPSMVTPMAGQLFIKEPIGKGQGSSKIYHEQDIQTFGRLKAEGQAVSKAKYGVGYNKTMYKKRIGMEIDITQEMRDENRYSDVANLIISLAHFGPQRIELDQTHRLSFASSTSYTDMDGQTVDVTGGDSLAVIHNAHTLKFSSDTYSNRVTGDPVISQGAIEVAENMMTTEIRSNFGEKRTLRFNKIITGDNATVCNTVRQILNSTADIDGTHAGVLNVNKGKYQHIELPYLATTATGAPDATKKYWWFIGAIGNGSGASWQAYYGEWEAPHMKNTSVAMEGSNADDFSRDVWSYGTRAGYGLAVLGGRGLIGSLPTSS